MKKLKRVVKRFIANELKTLDPAHKARQYWVTTKLFENQCQDGRSRPAFVSA